MILGLDVSTTRIGWAIIDEKQERIDSDFFKTDKKMGLEERASDFADKDLEPLKHIHKITEVRIEEPFSMFSGGKTTARTMSSLQRSQQYIKPCCSSAVWQPHDNGWSHNSRSRCGIKVPRGTKAKVVSRSPSGLMISLISL